LQQGLSFVAGCPLLHAAPFDRTVALSLCRLRDGAIALHCFALLISPLHLRIDVGDGRCGLLQIRCKSGVNQACMIARTSALMSAMSAVVSCARWSIPPSVSCELLRFTASPVNHSALQRLV
jgi:hypothetical protein